MAPSYLPTVTTVANSVCRSYSIARRGPAIANFTPSRSKPLLSQATPFSQSTRLTYPRKDSMDKDSINTEASEYSKSATDDEGARQGDAAFDPDITDPQEQKKVAGKNTGGANNPLEVSPANLEVSKTRGKREGGAENSSSSSNTDSDRARTSGGSSPSKGRSVS